MNYFFPLHLAALPNLTKKEAPKTIVPNTPATVVPSPTKVLDFTINPPEEINSKFGFYF